jgi:hypothetical protein
MERIVIAIINVIAWVVLVVTLVAFAYVVCRGGRELAEGRWNGTDVYICRGDPRWPTCPS